MSRRLLAVLTAAVLLLLAGQASAATLDAPWSGGGPGSTAVVNDGSAANPEFTYSLRAFSGGWSFRTTAASTRAIRVPWSYSGFHSFFHVRVALEAYVRRNGVEVSRKTLISAGPTDCCSSPSNGFSYTGTATFLLKTGDEYGFVMSGSHFDSTLVLQGDLKLFPPVGQSAGPTIEAPARDIAQTTEDRTPSTSGAFFSDSALTITADHSELGRLVDNGDGTWTWTWTRAPDDDLGPTTIKVTATDADGRSVTDDFGVTPLPALRLADKAPNTVAAPGDTLRTSGRFTDDGGDRLTLSVDTSAGHFVDNGDGTWDWWMTDAPQTAPTLVTVTADDGHGHRTHDIFAYEARAQPTVSTDRSCFDRWTAEQITVTGADLTPGASGYSVIESDPGTDWSTDYGDGYFYDDNGDGNVTSDLYHNPDWYGVPDGPSVWLKLRSDWDYSVLAMSRLPLCDAPADTDTPQVTPPRDRVVSTTAAAEPVLFPPARATDPTDGTLPATCSPDSGSSFPVGETTVTCAAQDGAGNRGTATFTVKVLDTGAPTLHLPDDRTVEATGPGGAPVTWAATATDTADPAVDVACSPASGETLPLASTTVTCTATDDAGNQSTDSFHVNVVDTTPPALSRVDDVTQEATGPDGASVTFTGPTATDAVDGTVPVHCSRASGVFALGQTTVTCSATDAAGNSDSKEFHVVVHDTTAPTLNLPAPSVDATSPSGATVTYTAGARDLVSGDVATTCTPASGTLFAIGTATVTCSATDAAGNVRRGTFTVVVKSASTQISDLETQITALNLGQGAGPAVNTKLQEALGALNQSNSAGAPSACGKLGAADNQIQSQSIVKQIGQAAADALSAKVRRIRTVAGC